MVRVVTSNRARTRRPCRRLVHYLCAMTLVWGGEALGVNIPVGLDLVIFLKSGGGLQRESKSYKEKWDKACTNMKQLFENPGGLLGRGPFQSATCRIRPTTLDEITGASPKPSWAMQIIDDDRQSGIEIFYLGAPKPRLEAIELTSASERFMEGLVTKKVASAMAVLLQDRLPMFSLVSIAPESRQIEVSSPLLADPLPAEFVVFTLEFDPAGDLWVPGPVGFIKTENSGLGENIKWKVKLHQGSFHTEKKLFIHNAQGRGKDGDSASHKISSLLGHFGVTKLAEGMMNALSENLSGIRYGYPLFPSSDVVGKSKMLSLFSEVRAGPLSGLRLYYDMAPKVTEVISNGDQTYFGWSAIDIGWAFGMSLPGFLAPIATRMDLQPKAGVVTLDSKLGGIDEYGTQCTAQFQLKNSIIFGLEMGLERDFFKLALLRGWAGVLYSGASLGMTKTQFTSLRSGIDAYWDVTNIGPFKFKALVFASVEELTIDKQIKKSADNSEIDPSAVINYVSYQLFFGGIGATMAW